MDRYSIYDQLLNSLKLAGRRTFLNRYIYIGEHKNDKYVIDLFKNIITTVNEEYCDEKITGFLLVYANHFIHLIDGAEDTIIDHFNLIQDHDKQILETTKMLIIYHHINQRMFDEWGYRTAKPPILLEKIDQTCDEIEAKRFQEICIKKFYNLAINLRQRDPEKPNLNKIGEILSHHSQFLPVYNLLEFILNRREILKTNIVQVSSNNQSQFKRFYENIWPVRKEFIPYNVFEGEINPIPNLFESPPPEK